MRETLSEFRQILEDVELEGEAQPDLMGLKTSQPGNEVGVQGEEGSSPQGGAAQRSTSITDRGFKHFTNKHSSNNRDNH